MICISNATLKYTKEFCAINNISLDIAKGEIVALCGPKDSGKSCLIRMCAGLEKLTSGEIYIKDIPVSKLDTENDISMGYIPWKGSFFENKTVYENFLYVLKVRKVPKQDWENIINKLLIDYKIEKLKDVKVKDLSMYDRYYVSLARLGYRKIELLLIDNIFEELDEKECKNLLNLIKKDYSKQGTTILYATSDEKLAESISTKIVKLNDGVIVK
jgi:multiple sugar transport system ATP-binding protein